MGFPIRQVSQPWILLGTALLGTFLGAFYNSVAGVALIGVLRDYPETAISHGAWFLTGYMFATAVCLPLAGRLVDFKGARRVYLHAVWVFGVASLLVAVAPSYEWVIAGRVVQGIAGAPVLPIVFMTISISFPVGRRGRAMGVWASANAASLALGPLLGGAILEFAGWRAIFWAGAPLAVLAFVAAYMYLPDYGRDAEGSFDALGAVLMTASLSALMLALSNLKDWGVFSVATGAFIVGAGLLMVLYFLRAERVHHPFFDLRLFSNPTYARANMLVGLQMMILFGLQFIIPLLMVYGIHTSQLAAGAMVSMMTLMGVLLGPFSGHFAERKGSRRPLMLAGGAMCAGALVLAFFMNVVAAVLAGMVLLGVGMALVQSPAALAVASELASSWSGVVMGGYNTVRFLSGVAGAAIFATLFEAIAGVDSGGSLGRVPPGMLERGFRAVFVIMIVAGALISVIAMALPRKRGEGSPGSASSLATDYPYRSAASGGKSPS